MVAFRYFIADKTLILCNSGAISPKMEFSITSHINELVKAYGERVNLLEEKVYKYMVTQNRMQLANAGYSCYYTFYKNKTSRTGFFGYSSMSNNHFQIANEVSGANVNITTNGGQVQANGSEVATKEYVDNLLRSTMNVLLTNLGMEDTTLFPEAETLEEL